MALPKHNDMNQTMHEPTSHTGKVKRLEKRLYTLKEAARYLGRSEWGMRELLWAGKIPVVKEAGARKIFVDIVDLDAFIDRNKTVYL